jgi:hypothetical protein
MPSALFNAFTKGAILIASGRVPKMLNTLIVITFYSFKIIGQIDSGVLLNLRLYLNVDSRGSS